MSKPYDATLKDLIEAYPADWLAFTGLRSAARVTAIDADVSTVTAAADKVLLVQETPPWILHLELQAGPKSDLAEWLFWYNALVGHRHRFLVRSAVVLLQPAADSPALTGTYEKQFAGEPPYLVFHYRVLRVWKVPVEQVLAGGLGMLPLAPLSDVPAARLPGVIQQMQARLSREATREKADVLWATTYILMGLRYSDEVAAQLLQGVSDMEESVTYQAILAKGRAQGQVSGKAEEARAILLRLGRKRFGSPAPTALEAISDVERLERMSERLLEVSTWEELLATP